MMQRAHEGRAITIFGDGQQTRDFVFVGDLVRGALLLVQKEGITGAFNIGTHSVTSITDLANEVIKLSGKEIEVHYSDPRPGDIKYSLSCNDKLKVQGWKPQVSFSDAMKVTWGWFINGDDHDVWHPKKD